MRISDWSSDVCSSDLLRLKTGWGDCGVGTRGGRIGAARIHRRPPLVVGRGYAPDAPRTPTDSSQTFAGAAKSRRGRSPDLRQGSADCLAVGSHGGFGAVEVEFDGMAAALAEDAGDGGFEGGAVVVEAAVGTGVGAVGRAGWLAGGWGRAHV